MQENYPIFINSTAITNFDWSEDFDKQIRETANRTQQVKQAEAKRLAADAQAYENMKIAQNFSVMQAQWNYEIQLEHAKHFNGKEVPDAAYIVPGTGTAVPLSVK